MRCPSHRKLIEQACAKLKLDMDGAAFRADLKRWGYADTVEDLKLRGYQRLVDSFILRGFRHRSRPIISTDTQALVRDAYTEMGATKHIFDTDLRRYGGVGDLRDLDGDGLLRMQTIIEHRGIDLDAWKAKRRDVTTRQVRALGLARRSIGLADLRYYDALQLYGGVNTGSDLDQRGVTLILTFMEMEGFTTPGMEDVDQSLADRPGFASPQQVRLIQALWAEWTGDAGEAALNHWLERYYRVSALRFLTAPHASKAITALKAMKRRTAERPKVTA